LSSGSRWGVPPLTDFAERACRGAGATVGGASGTPRSVFIGLAAPKKKSATFFHPVNRGQNSRRCPLSCRSVVARRAMSVFQLRPTLLHPPVDGFVVALGGSACRSLPTPL